MSNRIRDWLSVFYSVVSFLGLLSFAFLWHQADHNYRMNVAKIEEGRLAIEENRLQTEANLRSTADVLTKDQIDIRRSLALLAEGQNVIQAATRVLQKNQENATMYTSIILENEKNLTDKIFANQAEILRRLP